MNERGLTLEFELATLKPQIEPTPDLCPHSRLLLESRRAKMEGMQKVVGLVNRLQQICSSLGETALSANAVLWNKLPTIVVVGGQVRLMPC